MNLRLIQIPVHSNKGGRLDLQREVFERIILDNASGFNKREVEGVWDNGAGNQPQSEAMVEYQVAAEVIPWKVIVAEAKRLFHDQEAFFTATLGVADIIDGLASTTTEAL